MPRPKTGQEPRPGGKLSTSFRLDGETIQRISRLSTALHISKAAVVELGVRLLAQREKLE